MRTELATCFDAIGSDRSIRVVVLTGAGRAFSGGGDINDFAGTAQGCTRMGRVSHRWFRSFLAAAQPRVAAVNGAAGAAAVTWRGCDLVYASENAYFVQTFLDIGLVPDLGARSRCRASSVSRVPRNGAPRRANSCGACRGARPRQRRLSRRAVAARSARARAAHRRQVGAGRRVDQAHDEPLVRVVDGSDPRRRARDAKFSVSRPRKARKACAGSSVSVARAGPAAHRIAKPRETDRARTLPRGIRRGRGDPPRDHAHGHRTRQYPVLRDHDESAATAHRLRLCGQVDAQAAAGQRHVYLVLDDGADRHRNDARHHRGQPGVRVDRVSDAVFYGDTMRIETEVLDKRHRNPARRSASSASSIAPSIRTEDRRARAALRLIRKRTPTMPVDYRLLRSWLFVPGDSERKLARCWDFPPTR